LTEPAKESNISSVWEIFRSCCYFLPACVMSHWN